MARNIVAAGCLLSLCLACSIGRAQTILNQTVPSPRMTSITVPETPMVRTPSNLPTYMTSINFPLIYGSYAVFPYAAPPSFTSMGSMSSNEVDLSMRPVPVVVRAFAPALEAPASGAKITVVVPRSADVFFQGMQVPMSGVVKQFTSPELNPLLSYTYDIRVVWRDNGQLVSQAQRVIVKAGDDIMVTFANSPAPRPLPPPLPPPTVTSPVPTTEPLEPVTPAKPPLVIPAPPPSKPQPRP
jgi:uncharacterized protein (TIGR03000 family)